MYKEECSQTHGQTDKQIMTTYSDVSITIPVATNTVNIPAQPTHNIIHCTKHLSTV